MSDLNHKVIVSRHGSPQATRTAYIAGYAISIYLTLSAYMLVVHHLISRRLLIGSVASLAAIQFIVQLMCFLHLGKEDKPRWKFMVFLFMLLVVGIVVIGSLWIMSNLDYHMTSAQMSHYMNNQDGL